MRFISLAEVILPNKLISKGNRNLFLYETQCLQFIRVILNQHLRRENESIWR